MLPRVFASEKKTNSEVWLSELVFHRGERYQVTAESGAGKSSLCSYIYGARTDFSGKLLFNGKDSAEFSIGDWQQIRRCNIAYLPQELMLFPELSAIDNILLKADLTKDVGQTEIEEWLGLLGISSRRDYPAGKLSVGQQQRVAIIRSLCQPFDFLLLDEPVSHLDEENNRKAARLIEKQAEKYGAAIISTSVGNPLLLDNATTVRL